MRLSECKYGVLVQKLDGGEIGMIVGVTNNAFGSPYEKNPSYAIPLVQWQNGDTRGIHHENIDFYRD